MCKTTSSFARSSSPPPARVASSASLESSTSFSSSPATKAPFQKKKDATKHDSTTILLDYLQFAAAVILPFFIPPGSIFAEGFTRWWLRITLFYLIYGYKYQNVAKFQATLGLSINVGWYLVSTHDWLWKGRQFGNIVYRNIRGLRNITIAGSWSAETLVLSTGPKALLFRVLSMVLDTALHPLLCYYFWRKVRGTPLDQVATWSNLLSTFMFSRLWSLCQNYKNYGTFSVYYRGPHVYYLPPDHEDIYNVGYVGETLCLGALVLYKLYCMHQRRKEVLTSTKVKAF